MGSNFRKAMMFVLKWEGGYVNHPHDVNGSNNKGITQKTYTEFLDNQDKEYRLIKDITDEEVLEIYKASFWDHISGDSLPYRIALPLFDYAITSGVYRSVTDLQKILGVPPDGVFNPLTSEKLHEYIDTYGIDRLIFKFIQARHDHYLKIGSRVEYIAILKNWMTRLWDVYEEVFVCEKD
jgi:lysozyme family protein